MWRDLLGQTGAGLAADGDDNGQVEIGDYMIWNAAFGELVVVPGAGAAAAAVPEPSAGTLSWVAVGCIVSFPRRR